MEKELSAQTTAERSPVVVPLENAACPVCHSEGVSVFTQRDLLCGIAGVFGQRYCSECGAFFLSPRVPESEIWRYYPDSYAPYQRQAAHPTVIHKLADALGLPLRRRRIVERFVSGGKILDAGCGNGFFLKTLEDGQWETYAMDVKCHDSAGFSGEFFEGRFDHEKPPWNGFDAITLWHVFEHLYHPEKALENASALLTEGGFLFLAIPDLANLDRRIFGKYWVGWDPPRHIATYSATAIETLLRRSGLHPIDVVPDVCTGELLLYNVDFFLRSRGIATRFRSSLVLRLLLAPFVFALVRAGLAPAKIYVARK